MSHVFNCGVFDLGLLGSRIARNHLFKGTVFGADGPHCLSWHLYQNLMYLKVLRIEKTEAPQMMLVLCTYLSLPDLKLIPILSHRLRIPNVGRINVRSGNLAAYYRYP